MTKPMIDLCALAEKGVDADLLREMIAFPALMLMAREVDASTRADYGETSSYWPVPGNSHRNRD
ncbi:hypothetical protein [Salipiger bermudensis]|mgnify:FL=1|uniref:hypothetical protein n=1 Tax=Salipiger bermudensis TaxID=344736 RepID=UPI001F971C2D|nr:hypothetical protein [bacterium]|tara:strand:- start:266 stop:457 length:192 start_codon:yes stop_codon:yes gene_type:complete